MNRPSPVPGFEPPPDFDAAELLEDEPVLVVRNARAAIGDGDEDNAVLRLHVDVDLVARSANT